MIPSPFGRRLPRGVGKSENKKDNPLGERVEPRVKNRDNPKAKAALKRIGVRVRVKIKKNVVGPSAPVILPPSEPASPLDVVALQRADAVTPSDLALNDPRGGVAVVGRFVPWPWKQHPDEAYLADALERIGLIVHRVNQDLPRPPLPEAEWAIFTGHPGSLARFEQWRKTHPTIVWTLDWLPDFPDRHAMMEAGRRATLFLTSDQYDWRGKGVMHHGYLPGACETVDVPFNPKPEISCAFMGTLYNNRRKEIADLVRKYDGIVLDQSGRWKYGRELSELLQTVKVLIGDNYRNDVAGYWSTRNYIVPGAGGFLLTPEVPGLELQFKLEKEIAVYDSLENLEKRLHYWIHNDHARERVRRAGFDRVRREHTWDSRARALLMHISGRINASS